MKTGFVKSAVAAPRAAGDAVRGLLSDRRHLEGGQALSYGTHAPIRSVAGRYEGLLGQLDQAGTR